MGAIRTAADTTFRDYRIDGNAASRAHTPVKADIRALFGIVEDSAGGAGSTGGIEPIERPGDAPDAFTSTVAGDGAELEALSIGTSTNNVDGAARRLVGAGIVATRPNTAIEDGVVYATRWALRRHTNPSDPLGDAVEIGIQWLDNAKAALSSTVVFSGALVTADGLKVVQRTMSRDQAADIVIPPTACYRRPYIRTYGDTSGVTDIEVIRNWETSGLPGPQGDDGDLTVEAEAIRDEMIVLEANVEAIGAAVMIAGPAYDTTDDLATTVVPSGAEMIRVNSIHEVGDAMPMFLKRLAATPSPVGSQHFPSDGAWWEDTNRRIDAEARGVVADDATDNTAALQAVFDEAAATNRSIILPNGIIRTDTITLDAHNGIAVFARGRRHTTLKPTGSGASLLHLLGSGSADFYARDFGINTNGTGMRAVNFDGEGTGTGNSAKLENLYITGDLTGDLMISTSQIINILGCNIVVGANTNAMTYFSFNQNCQFNGNIVGGLGSGVWVRKNGSLATVEGLSLIGNKFINSGAFNFKCGTSYMTQAFGNIFDQAYDAVVVEGLATFWDISHNWCGASSGNGVRVQNDAGAGGKVTHNFIRGALAGMSVAASASSRVSNLLIGYNTFFDAANNALTLDSVGYATIVGNEDYSPSANGSWVTQGTHASKGNYKFDNNTWQSNNPLLVDPSSTYRFGSDTGIIGRRRDISTAPGGATTAVTVSHGINPTLAGVLGVRALVTPRSNAGAFYTSSHGTTGFNVNWATSGTPTFDYEAYVGN